ncbi:MAG: TolC family protein [Planctomycetales bacterium]|nr:TolC family protein [Planctomycetales bacterium]
MFAVLLTVGCATRRNAQPAAPAPSIAGDAPAILPANAGPPVVDAAQQAESAPRSTSTPTEIAPVTFQTTSNGPTAIEVVPQQPLDAGGEPLNLAVYVNEVLARNRSLQAMVAAWRSAAEKYPQAVALDDPMFTAMTAPASLSSNDVNPAYLIGGSQKISWWGKRSLRGQVASAEARAASMDVAAARLQLTQAAHLAYFDYYLVHRQRELTAANVARLDEFRTSARRQYEANLVMQQDVLQAEVELAEAERRRIELERMLRISTARLNTLVHQPPDCPVPPPPPSLSIGGKPAPAELLRQVALQQRPDLSSMRSKLRADSASLALAYKEFYPDFEVMGRYDRFWQPTSTQGDFQGQIGVNMNVPIYLEKRRAAAREAMFKLRQQRAELEQRMDDVNQEVESALAQVAEMRAIVELYEQRTLPAAEQNVSSARNDYVANRGDFLRLISAQRQLLMLQEKYQEAVAGYLSRFAELERSIGGPVPMDQLSVAVSVTP